MIRIKLKDTLDFYPTMEEWAKERNFPLPPLSFLPTKTIVGYKDETPVYSICIYHTDSEVMWIGWELSNKRSELSDREIISKQLINYIELYATSLEYKHIITTSGTPQVEKLLNYGGYLKGDENVNHYIKNI